MLIHDNFGQDLSYLPPVFCDLQVSELMCDESTRVAQTVNIVCYVEQIHH